MKTNNGFTFIEIVISITIFSLLSYFAVTSFQKNVVLQSSQENIASFLDIMDELDIQLWQNVSDYTLELWLWKIYSYTKNTLWLSYQQSLIMNNLTGSIIANTGSFLKIIRNNELLLFTQTPSLSYTYSFLEKWDYRIEGTFSGAHLNDLYINYFGFSKDNKDIELYNINDINNNSYSWIVITNQLWQTKKILTLTWQVISSPITLSFYHGDIPFFITLP